MNQAKWGKFHKVAGVKFTPADWCETIDGGQAFTWFKTENANEFEGVFSDVAAKVKLQSKSVQISFLDGADERRCLKKFSEYIDAHTDYEAIRTSLERSGDIHMKNALKIYPSLRILRQNPSEAIVCFICSSSKRIVQIKQCVKLLSEKFGTHLGGNFYKIPDFETLANAQLKDILECKLGFRARYLKETAEKIVSEKFNPLSLREMPYQDAKRYLVSLSGIGDKVADCILLFGCSRLEAFPVDTWIRQAMCQLYNTENDVKKIRAYAAQKFPSYAGFAQQLIFAAKRNALM